MFEARKRVFVDLLKWDIPVLDGRFEIDQFDDGHAVYIVLTDPVCGHLASARLLPTTRPGILSGLYAHLCDGELPAGASVFEITRFCLSPDLHAADRRRYRDTLIIALARYALETGIETYTAIAADGWLQQILAFGWDAHLLGRPQHAGQTHLGALRIEIAADTIAKLERAGIHAEADAFAPLSRAA